MVNAVAMPATLATTPLALQLLAGLAYALGGAAMKLSHDTQHAAWVGMVYACFIVGATLQMRSLRFTDFGTGYVLVVGLEAALSVAVATMAFGERPGLAQWAGIAMVVGGAALLRA